MRDAGHDESDALLTKMQAEVEDVYRTAQKDLQKKIDDYVGKFAKDDAKKQKLVANGKISQEDYEAWKQKAMLTGKQYRQMLNTVSTDLTNADQIARSIINGYTPEAYAVGMNYGTYQVESGTTFNTNFTLYNRESVERLLRDDPQLLPMPKVNIPKDKAWNYKHIKSAVTQGIIQGESMPKIAKRLENVVGMDKRAAIRNARTAVNGAENAGRMDSFMRAKEMGIGVKKQWLATPDGRTRDSHVEIDLEVVELEENFSNGCEYPGDPGGDPAETYNCRCAMIPWLDRFGDKFDGERMMNLHGMTYDEWKESHTTISVPAQEEVPRSFAEMLADNDGDAVDARDMFVDTFGQSGESDFWGTTEASAAIERTVSELQKKYPMQSSNPPEYRSTFDHLVLCDYSHVGWHLPNGDEDQRIDDSYGVIGQVFAVYQDGVRNTAVIAFDRDSMFGTVAEGIRERGEAIARGEDIYVLGGYSAELSAVHEWGHVMSEHISTAMINGDSDAHEYWDWYRSLTKDEIASGISHYAAENRAEFEAECFLEMQMPNPRPIAVKFRSFMEKMLAKGY